MGKYNFAAQRVHQTATRLLKINKTPPPPWYDTIGSIPPSERLTRPALQQRTRNGKNASRMFKPLQLKYPEDELRAEFFGDHPWELARPRVVLENDGNDHQRYDWSQIQQPGKPLDGESVVQRQRWLMLHEELSKAQAYDKARKEFYDLRHSEDIERRIAKEEALKVGAFFGMSPLEVGAELEDRAFEDWRAWAEKEVQTMNQLAAAGTTGLENEDAVPEVGDEATEAGLEEVAKVAPNSRRGQEALGGAVTHP